MSKIKGIKSNTIYKLINYHWHQILTREITKTFSCLLQVGPVFGRKMMKGYLDMQTQGTFASEHRVRESLSRVAPIYHHRRQRGAERLINPQPYTAEYHGHKLHMDQNEKLANYGVVHVCAIDGFSRYIPSFACMPAKNNVLIYEHVYRWVGVRNYMFS